MGIGRRRFAERYQLPYSLVADPRFAIAKEWGVARPLGLGAWRVTYVVDREGIIRGAFHCPRRLEGLAVAVVDDVMTTGATLYSAARCLQAAGAASVSAVVLARTPRV